MSRPQDRAASTRRPHFARIDTHVLFCAQLAEATGGEVVRSTQIDWFSVTFAGARYSAVLRLRHPFDLGLLPDHEFDLPHAFVADLAIVGTDGDRVTVEALIVNG